jgi:hypothetical protein
MKLNDICNNERFVKGELYGAYNLLRYIQQLSNGAIVWNKMSENYVVLNDWKPGVSGFYNKDITRDDWKLYEFIDGKMVEVKEQYEPACQTCINLLSPKEIAKGLKNCQDCLSTVNEKLPAAYGFIAEEIPLNENGASVVTEKDREESIKWIKRNTIMQPIEAIRWMRENINKIIYRNEGSKAGQAIRFFSFNGEGIYKYKKYCINIENIPKDFEHSEWEIISATEALIFMAYTYRIVEE